MATTVAKVALITDSTACLPRELVERFDITVVPVELVFGGRIYRDGVDDLADFYTLLKRSPQLPTTSPSSPGTYLAAYRQASQRAEAVLCITVSSSVSAMYDSARAARELAREALPQLPIEVMDSGTATMAQGFIVLAAARAVAEGKALPEVVAAAQRAAHRVSLVCFLDTLYYLARSGRVPKAAAWAASLLQLKPIIRMHQGNIELLARTRTRNRATARLLDLVAQEVGGRPVHMAVMHTQSAEDAAELRRLAASRFHCRELYVTEFTPVMGSHTGPGLLGLAYYLQD